jgi:tetratricopeptide (TPR) repeat protein
LAKKKVRAKDLKNQRWAAIVAAVLALGMLLSLVGVYIGQAVGDGSEGVMTPEQQAEPQPEDYLTYYKEEVQRLEAYLEEHDPTVPVLMELAENYRYLVFIQQVFFEDEAAVDESRQNLTSVFTELIDMEPENLSHRLEMVNLQLEMEEVEAASEEISLLLNLLREDPNPVIHLSLINIMVSSDFTTVTEEEIAWLNEYLSERVDTGEANSEDRFYLAVLFGEYMNDTDAALELLEEIIAEEEDESPVYQDALGYLEYLQPGDDNGETTPE